MTMTAGYPRVPYESVCAALCYHLGCVQVNEKWIENSAGELGTIKRKTLKEEL